MRNCFQYPLEWLSETSKTRLFSIPFIITNERVHEGCWWGNTLPRGRRPPLLQVNSDYAHRDEIRELFPVST